MSAAAVRAVPNVYTIPAGAPFADVLAEGILAQAGGDPLALSGTTVLLPTRRAVRVLTDAFLRAGGGVRLLPAIRPIGDVDEDELSVHLAEGAADLPPAMDPLRRQLRLAQLVQDTWARVGLRGDPSPSAALRIAGDLAALLDECAVQGVSFAELQHLAAERFAAHWQLTATLLGDVAAEWPAICAAEGVMEPAARRDALTRALAARWRETPPHGPVIAAGSTGSIPATAELLHTIAHLPDGAVVLPGLDTALDEESFEALGPEHPQYGLAQLLKSFGIARSAVRLWPGGAPAPASRAAVWSEALRPAPSTGRWSRLAEEHKARLHQGLTGLRVMESDGAQDEARAIALLLREALETPGRTAALVTPDRNLARRVAAELLRFGIAIDDSAGVPLAKTAPGHFLVLLAEAAAADFAPLPLLAFLKHPLLGCGVPPAAACAGADALERAVLRGLAPPPGLSGLRAALAAAKPSTEREAALASLDRFAARVGPLLALPSAATPGARIAALLPCAEDLAATDAQAGAERLWAGPAGEAAALFAAGLAEAAAGLPAFSATDFAALLTQLMQSRPVRAGGGRHPRLAIWGPLEARLQRADLTILGGLNEGVWPELPQTGPWLNRAMRQAKGLEPPERRIGLSAHDFAQAASGPEVVLSRARRPAGEPASPSRWLVRLEQLLRGLSLSDALQRAPHAAWARVLDAPDRVTPAPRPAPRPPVAARPRKLSVTRVERLIRDPYQIYAQSILRLGRLDAIARTPDARDRGTLVHKILERFAIACPGPLDAGGRQRLDAIASEEIAALANAPLAAALWTPRIRRALDWIWAWETARREDGRAIVAERSGEMRFDAPLGEIVLTAKADRIEVLRNGTLAIVDYKTGRGATDKEVSAGWAPQLPLEAAIAGQGGFPDVPARPVSELTYVRVSGGGAKPGEELRLGLDAAAVAQRLLDQLRALMAMYDDPATAYRSRIAPQYSRDSSDYDHLARVAEWSSGGSADD